ncbi:hypothetical protein ASPBRDRAFT_28287 [Aspergillus brasiliensis CBS 101740]|uniref:Uncharacterized protein n=1 Tax=Aspergillus brasiliensis (strain CBS 101740 / IMI 381727 / IBT 21946) TaxID=767769 RepID=A0A1L9UUC8_ASPBC|nr:hypothetical protein ASPBRDRAFT_28287 [Aspergillus brasiliensis CBS 101740]
MDLVVRQVTTMLAGWADRDGRRAESGTQKERREDRRQRRKGRRKSNEMQIDTSIHGSFALSSSSCSVGALHCGCVFRESQTCLIRWVIAIDRVSDRLDRGGWSPPARLLNHISAEMAGNCFRAINSPIGEAIPLSILQDPEIHHRPWLHGMLEKAPLADKLWDGNLLGLLFTATSVAPVNQYSSLKGKQIKAQRKACGNL